MSTSNKRKSSAPVAGVAVAKTLKCLINGGFARSESGATFPVLGFEVPDASRKDARDSVRAGATASNAWAQRDPYNRGQILYRVAEMLQARADEFVELGVLAGLERTAAALDVERAVDVWVHYAGWSDKVNQVLGSVNDVSGPFVSYTGVQPSGLTVAIVDGNQPFSLETASAMLASSLAAGNAVTLCVSGAWSVPLLVFGEVVGTSDVPAGVIQLLSSSRSETPLTLASASQVSALELTHAGPNAGELAVASTQTLTRVLRSQVPATGLGRIRWQVERRTFWHPTAR